MNQFPKMKAGGRLFIKTGDCYCAIGFLDDFATLAGAMGSVNPAIRRDHHPVFGMVDQRND
jgi:hypothetical protein